MATRRDDESDVKGDEGVGMVERRSVSEWWQRKGGKGDESVRLEKAWERRLGQWLNYHYFLYGKEINSMTSEVAPLLSSFPRPFIIYHLLFSSVFTIVLFASLLGVVTLSIIHKR